MLLLCIVWVWVFGVALDAVCTWVGLSGGFRWFLGVGFRWFLGCLWGADFGGFLGFAVIL